LGFLLFQTALASAALTCRHIAKKVGKGYTKDTAKSDVNDDVHYLPSKCFAASMIPISNAPTTPLTLAAATVFAAR
jgi:hypothetical protein